MGHRKLVVGLPVYNGENYLEHTLQALLAQTFEDFTVVVSDNASTDATPDIVKDLTGDNPRVVYMRHAKNLGAAPNYNAAFTAAEPSDYFAWVAHDDIPRPSFFGSCIDALDDDPTTVLAFSETSVIDAYGNSIGRYPSRPALTSPSAAVRFGDVIDQHSSNHPIFGVMRRSALDRTHLHGSYTGSDRTLLAELALLGPFVEVPGLLFGLREHPARSVRANLAGGKTRNRDVWFDTSKAGKLVFPRWRRVRDYMAAIATAPVSTGEKLRLLAELGKWTADGNWKALSLDIAGAGKTVAARATARIR